MTGFNDLIPVAQPALVGGGCNAAGTAGADWSWTFNGLNDTTGAAIDLTSATVTCLLRDVASGGTILTLTGTGGSGKFTVSATAANTAGLASAGTPSKYKWSCTLTLSGKVVAVWDFDNSTFQVRGS